MSELLNQPEALRQLRLRGQQLAEMIRLPLRNKIWRGGSGEFAGAGTGSSLEFQDHRAYMAGDDPRHINWQAYARTGQYSMKVFREEVRPMVDLILDVSASQFYDPVKATRVVELFQFCISAANKAGASLHVSLINGPAFIPVGNDHLLTDAWAQRLPQHQSTSVASDPPALDRLPLRAQAMRILISDLLYPGAPDHVLRPLSDRQGRGIIFSPFCHAEAKVEWNGNYEFVDPESQTHHLRRVEPSLLKRYQEAYRRHCDLWKAASLRYGILLARVEAELDFHRALQFEAQVIGAVEIMA